MKKQLGLLMGLAIVGVIALPASGGGGAAVSMEKSLLNIRILQSYKKVLARYGQPTRIYQRNEGFDFIPAVDVKKRSKRIGTDNLWSETRAVGNIST